MERKQILGWITITAIVGGTAYAIYKYKKESNEEVEVWTAEDAKREIERIRAENQPESQSRVVGVVVGEVSDVIDESTETDKGSLNLDGMVEYEEKAKGYSSLSELKKDEEENKLRYEPNSNEALEQFINMELAEWNVQDYTRARMFDLFSFPLITDNEGDLRTISQIADYRADFFGIESKWNGEVTFADLILHYARHTDYNYGHGIRHWVEHILEVSGLDDAEEPSEIKNIISGLNQHNYYNHAMDTYTLFGLDFGQAQRLLNVAKEDITGKVSYDMEFNMFLEECM